MVVRRRLSVSLDTPRLRLMRWCVRESLFGLSYADNCRMDWLTVSMATTAVVIPEESVSNDVRYCEQSHTCMSWKEDASTMILLVYYLPCSTGFCMVFYLEVLLENRKLSVGEEWGAQ